MPDDDGLREEGGAVSCCTCEDPRLTLGENADVRYPVNINPECPVHGEPPAPPVTDTEAGRDA